MNDSRDTPPLPEYANPPVADGINNPPGRPARTLAVNLALVAAGLFALLFLFNLAVRLVAPLTPLAWERLLVNESAVAPDLDAAGRARQEALRVLAKRIAAAMDLPGDMDVLVHYDPSSTKNAYAVLGGHVMVCRGLIELVDSEDALAMVLAHEMAHVAHRDMLKGLARAGGLLLLSAGTRGGDAIIEALTAIGLAGYSRGQEAQADAAAVRALGRLYGHAGGARHFFAVVVDKIEGRGENARERFSLMSTHPDTLRRMRLAAEEAESLGIAPDGELTPLPEVFR